MYPWGLIFKTLLAIVDTSPYLVKRCSLLEKYLICVENFTAIDQSLSQSLFVFFLFFLLFFSLKLRNIQITLNLFYFVNSNRIERERETKKRKERKERKKKEKEKQYYIELLHDTKLLEIVKTSKAIKYFCHQHVGRKRMKEKLWEMCSLTLLYFCILHCEKGKLKEI